jgi:hypothetical protein
MSTAAPGGIGIARSNLTDIPHFYLGQEGEPDAPICTDPRRIQFFGRIWLYKRLEFLMRVQERRDRSFHPAGSQKCRSDARRVRRLGARAPRFGTVSLPALALGLAFFRAARTLAWLPYASNEASLKTYEGRI